MNSMNETVLSNFTDFPDFRTSLKDLQFHQAHLFVLF
jgi:hypothetical protein